MPKKQSNAGPEVQLASFIAKFDPDVAKLIGECRAQLRALLPTAIELVYDNYNFFVIGYCSTDKPSSCIVSLAAAANGVLLSFYYGASLKDPECLLEGSGKQNRFIRLPRAAILRSAGVLALIKDAAARGKVALPESGKGATVIQSISAKQRPRRNAKRLS